MAPYIAMAPTYLQPLLPRWWRIHGEAMAMFQHGAFVGEPKIISVQLRGVEITVPDNLGASGTRRGETT